jgi:formiminotetrahydrofolate cyclodeaminase
MAFAAVQSASMNVRINALSTADRKLADGWINQIVQIEGNADRLNQMIQSVIKERGGI